MDILKTLGVKKIADKVLPIAAGFNPILGLISGALGVGEAVKNDRASNNASKAQQGILQELAGSGAAQSAQFQELLAPLVQSLVGRVNNFDPSSYIDPRYRNVVESAGALADSEIARNTLGFGERGLLDSSGFNTAQANARGKVGAAAAGAARQFSQEAEQQHMNDMFNVSNLLQGGVNTGNNLSLQAGQGFGGLAGMYASRNTDIFDAIGKMGQVGGSKIPVLTNTNDPNRGNNRLGTNQAPSALTAKPLSVTGTYGKPVPKAKGFY